MCNNRFSRLIIVMCVVCWLLITACNRSTSFAGNHSGYRHLAGAACPNLGGQLEVQCNSNDGCPYHFNWSQSNLCPVLDKKTALFQAIEMGNIDLLSLFLEYIQGDLVKYPPEKVICLIAGCGSETIRGMQIPLLIRAVVKGDLDALELLFATLHDYFGFIECFRGGNVGALYKEVFCSRFGPGKFTLIQEAVNACDLVPEMVAYLINKYQDLVTARLHNQVAAWEYLLFNDLLECLSIKNKAGATPFEMARENYAYGIPKSASPLMCLAQYEESVLGAPIEPGDVPINRCKQ